MVGNQAKFITGEQETFLWGNGSLGRENREIPCHTLVWVLGIQFTLRAGREHQDLRLKNCQLCLEQVQKLTCVLQPFFFVGFNPRNDRLKKKHFGSHTEIVASEKEE